MNLGSFAGGLASGYTAGERMKMQKAELELAQSRNKREQLRADREQKEFDLAEQDREATKQLWKKHYTGSVQDGEEQVADEGGFSYMRPKMKEVQYQHGDDPTRDLRFKMDVLTRQMTRDPSKTADLMSQMDKYVDESQARDWIGYINNGDMEAGARLGKAFGIDHTTAKVTQDPKSGRYFVTDASGKTLDATTMIARASGMNALAAISQQIQNVRDGERHDVGIRHANAQIGELEAKTEGHNLANSLEKQLQSLGKGVKLGQKLDADIGLTRAQARAVGINAEAARDSAAAQGKNADTNASYRQDTVNNQTLTQVDADIARAFPPIIGINGKTEAAHPGYVYVSGAIAGSDPKSIRAEAKAASDKFRIHSEAKMRDLAKLPQDKLKILYAQTGVMPGQLNRLADVVALAELRALESRPPAKTEAPTTPVAQIPPPVPAPKQTGNLGGKPKTQQAAPQPIQQETPNLGGKPGTKSKTRDLTPEELQAERIDYSLG